MTQQEKINDIIQDTDKNFAPYYDVIPNLIRERGYEIYLEIGVFCGGQILKVLETDIYLAYGIDPYKMYEPGMPRLDSQSDWDCLHDTVINRLNDKRYLHIKRTSDDAFNNVFSVYSHDDLFWLTWIDIVFIDALHTAEQLKKDLNNYSKIVNKGGIIACHDINHPTFPELTDVIYEFAREHNKEVVLGPLHICYIEKDWD